MGLFSKPDLPSSKPRYIEEREEEQEERIRRALAGLRSTYSSKSPFNVMLQSARGSGGTGSYSRQQRPAFRNLGRGMSSGIFTNQLVGLLPGRQSQQTAPQGTALNSSRVSGGQSD